MKKFIASLVLNLLISGVFAYSNAGLIVKAPFHEKVTVIFNGNSYNAQGQVFTLNNLHPGKHFLKIIIQQRDRYGRCLPARMAYKGYINVRPNADVVANVRPNFHTDIWIERKHYAMNNSCHNACTAPLGMSNYDFDNLVRLVENTPFDDRKLAIISRAIAANSITVDQLSILMETLAFDSTKLKLAKIGHTKVVDEQNFYRVYAAFDFNSSADELESYLAMY